ncbi:MAG: AraC family transcriptional regulator [Verrucomicrobiota bacterium]|mgnify:CR=1 FL=1|nr:AraC family transcriptional regulator [Verrucomicrobiota bacterium]
MSQRIIIDLRPLGIPEVPVLGRYDYRQAQAGLLTHAHRDVMEICYLAKGRQTYRVGKNDYALRGGDVFMTFPGEEHSTGEAPQEKGSLYWFHILLPKNAGPFLNYSREDSRKLLHALQTIPHRHFPGHPLLGKILDEILKVSEIQSPLQKITLQNRVIDFLLKIIDCSRENPRQTISPVISQLMRYIEANAHQTLPLGVLAARIRLSLPRLKIRFKEEVGIPPAEYVLRCKIEEAKRRLTKSKSNVIDVAIDLNFPSSQYFATVFRRYTGLSPTQFRTKLLIAANER